MSNRTAVELVRAGHARGIDGDNVPIGAITKEAAALDAEVATMRARLAVLEAFADEVRNIQACADTANDFAYAVCAATAKLPVKP